MAKVIVVVIKAVVPIIAKAFTLGAKALVRVALSITQFARGIVTAVGALWDLVVTKVIPALVAWYKKFKGWLAETFEPVVRLFRWINEWLDKIWTKVIAPILDVIEKLRLIFKILAELGLDWAGVVERFLQQLETRIYDTFREVRSWVNTLELWLDLLLDPGGWIKSTPFLYTVYKWGGNVVAILTKLGLDVTTPARIDIVRSENPRRPLSSTVERVKSGAIRDHIRLQNVAARFRSRGTGQ